MGNVNTNVIPDEGRRAEVQQLLDHPFPSERHRDVERRVAVLESMNSSLSGIYTGDVSLVMSPSRPRRRRRRWRFKNDRLFSIKIMLPRDMKFGCISKP